MQETVLDVRDRAMNKTAVFMALVDHEEGDTHELLSTMLGTQQSLSQQLSWLSQATDGAESSPSRPNLVCILLSEAFPALTTGSPYCLL